jgi:nitrogenase molybdenum-cofactor synthesis protein NifE
MPWLDINQERHHAFAGYEGMVKLVQEIDKTLYNPVWEQVRLPAPWDEAGVSQSAAVRLPNRPAMQGRPLEERSENTLDSSLSSAG